MFSNFLDIIVPLSGVPIIDFDWNAADYFNFNDSRW
jgi:hypothetical protein